VSSVTPPKIFSFNAAIRMAADAASIALPRHPPPIKPGFASGIGPWRMLGSMKFPPWRRVLPAVLGGEAVSSETPPTSVNMRVVTSLEHYKVIRVAAAAMRADIGSGLFGVYEMIEGVRAGHFKSNKDAPAAQVEELGKRRLSRAQRRRLVPCHALPQCGDG
jgi:hypothetical protein